MTETIYSRPGVVEAIDVHGRPFGVPLPACHGACNQGRTDCQHPELCIDDDWQRHFDPVPLYAQDDDGHPFGAFAGLRTVIVVAAVVGLLAWWALA